MPYSFIKDNYKPFFNTGVTMLNSVAISSGDENGYVNLSIGNQENKKKRRRENRSKGEINWLSNSLRKSIYWVMNSSIDWESLI